MRVAAADERAQQLARERGLPGVELALATVADTKLAHRHLADGERARLGGRSTNKEAFSSHCKRVSAKNEELAKEYAELAKMHEEAKKAP
jgi:hypothetical protein